MSSPMISDKLRAMKDLQVPVGERINERGEVEADMRSVDDLLDEAEARAAGRQGNRGLRHTPN